jgi:hypothetical protein
VLALPAPAETVPGSTFIAQSDGSRTLALPTAKVLGAALVEGESDRTEEVSTIRRTTTASGAATKRGWRIVMFVTQRSCLLSRFHLLLLITTWTLVGSDQGPQGNRTQWNERRDLNRGSTKNPAVVTPSPTHRASSAVPYKLVHLRQSCQVLARALERKKPRGACMWAPS